MSTSPNPLVKQNKGLVYENQVHKALCSCSDIQTLSDSTAGFSSHGIGDISFVVRNITCHLEVKLNQHAQMGSSQIKYDKLSNTFIPHPNALIRYNSTTLDELVQLCNNHLQDPIGQYLCNLTNPHTLPRIVSQSERVRLQQTNLGKQIRLVVPTPITTVANFYQSKGVHYMQVGSKGLFTVGEDILNISAPQLTGTAVIEVRLKFSSSRVELAITNRIKTLDNSPISLHDNQTICQALCCEQL